jgi:hypothetical protein
MRYSGFGRSPMQSYLDAIPMPKEPMIAATADTKPDPFNQTSTVRSSSG